MYGEIAKKFHEKFIGENLTENTMKIAHDYVKFIIDAYENMRDKNVEIGRSDRSES